MTPERFARLKGLLDEALARPEPERDGFAAAASCGDAALAEELRALLDAHGRAARAGFLERPAQAPTGTVDLAAPGPAPGTRLGAYEVVGELGRGGMGIVLKAVRADDAYRKAVAVKLVPAAGLSTRARERFLEERQILAALEHPNIARLLDGGTTAEGVPYLVMELVEGERIDAWCAARQAPVEVRLRLFLDVAAAVHHAHRNLVVHRDLKPGNVLVTADGIPKLLDFGVARLATVAGADATQTRALAFTPAYASPEQLRGEPIGTASDVYSLGALLHELLTGHVPRRASSLDGMAPAVATLAGVEPLRPSAGVPPELRRRLRGDLDVILLTALRSDPAARYGSAEAFADDVRRHLEGRPVRARAPTLPYRALKFVRRNAAAVAALALAAMALAGGAASTAWQARRAEAARALAERRLAEARRIAQAMIFDLHDAVAPLPGSTEVRRLVVARGLEYLDGVAREVSGDPSLCLELASAYRRIGDVQGGAFNANLGEPARARESYDRAVGLAEACGGPGANGVLAAALRARAAVRALELEAAGGLEDARRALVLTREAGGRAAPLDVALSLQAVGFAAFHGGDLAASRAALEEQVAILEAGVAGAPAARVGGMLASASWQLGGALWAAGDLEGAARRYGTALRLQEEALDRDPRDVRIRRQLAFTVESLGALGTEAGAPRLDLLRRAVELRRGLGEDDPSDADARLYLLGAEKNLAVGLARVGEGAEASALVERVLQGASAAARDRSGRELRALVAEAHGARSMVRRLQADRAAAADRAGLLEAEREDLRRAWAGWIALAREQPLNDRERQTRALVEARLAELDAALAPRSGATPP